MHGETLRTERHDKDLRSLFTAAQVFVSEQGKKKTLNREHPHRWLRGTKPDICIVDHVANIVDTFDTGVTLEHHGFTSLHAAMQRTKRTKEQYSGFGEAGGISGILTHSA
eukprot:GHVU01199743.1.p3 GENE.GHVU01199743.1~~GHVU01199743.1.p3  ORF type:complete len:110 (-),score=12.32 GHVU01199743.1:1536-1865(-)